MANQSKQNSFDLEFKGYTIRFESAHAGGYIVNCFDMTEKQRIYRVLICDLEEFFWLADELEACIEGYEARLAELKAEHHPEVIQRAKTLAAHGIKGALGAAYAARPMRPQV